MFLQEENVQLIPVFAGKLLGNWCWLNDTDTIVFLQKNDIIKEALQSGWGKDAIDTLKENYFTQLLFVVTEGASSENQLGSNFVGIASFEGIDYENGSTEFKMDIKEQYRDRGYGKEVFKLLMGYAFDWLRLRRLFCEVLEIDAKSIEFCESIGLKYEGLKRGAIYFEENYRNVFLYSLLKEEAKDIR